MDELLALILAEVAEDDIIESAALVISTDVLAEVAFDLSVLEEVYTGIVESLEVFKDWMAVTFRISRAIVDAMLALPLVYNMVYSHYEDVSESGKCISVEVALQDIEATLKKNFQKLIDLARKEIDSPSFGDLPDDVQQRIKAIPQESPMDYWVSARQGVLDALKHNPMYVM